MTVLTKSRLRSSIAAGALILSLIASPQIAAAALPATDPTGSWEQEDALDVEWAHAMAPGASLVLVEANSDSMADLISAAGTAAALPGVSVVSMSWGAGDFAGEAGLVH